ncbi:MAG: histidine kinase, partial [Nitrospirota bacterium]|nr:histidine kinase [Nitrospirota bacterium]
MTDEGAPEVPGRSPNVTGDHLRDANEQLTLNALRAQEQIERSAQRYQGLSEANQLLVRKQHQLRSLASQLTLVEQRERKRLATELHDYLAQMIVLGRLKIGQARLRITPADSSLTPLINDLDEIFTQALTYTRTLMADLSPTVLQQFGLPTALTWLGDQMSRHGLTVEVRLPAEGMRLPGDHATLLFQSVRE